MKNGYFIPMRSFHFEKIEKRERRDYSMNQCDFFCFPHSYLFVYGYVRAVFDGSLHLIFSSSSKICFIF